VKVAKVFNNNVVLAVGDDGVDVVLMGRGLGFGARPGDDVHASRIERTFGPGGVQTPERIAAFLAEIPADQIAVTEEIVEAGRKVLGEYVGWHVLIPLADHISFALRRAREGVTIAYPLRTEVMHLYPTEVAFSREAIAMVEQRLGVQLPELEAIPLALHFVNAQFDAPDLTRVVEMTEAFAAVLDEVGRFYGIDLDEDSIDVARFVTHLRYLARRQERGALHDDGLAALYETIRISHPRELTCAESVGAVLHARYGWDVGRDELLYLTLHIGRLAADAHGGR
jgi:beta-glucoside operon transcriptional antiterminator